MKSKGSLLTRLVFALLLAPLLPAQAGEVPPPGSKALSAILESIEAKKSGVITTAEFDDGLWEVQLCDGGACQKIYIDAKSGEERRRRRTDSDERPPANAKPLSTIIRAVEARGLGTITEVEFDDGFWEVELRKDGRKTKLAIDPLTGETRR